MARFFRRKKFCKFTAEGIDQIDYKDLATLKAYITETGKIVPSRITGTRSFYQRQLARRDQARALPGAAAVHGPALRPVGRGPRPGCDPMTALIHWLTAIPPGPSWRRASPRSSRCLPCRWPLAAGGAGRARLARGRPGARAARRRSAPRSGLVWVFLPAFGAAPALVDRHCGVAAGAGLRHLRSPRAGASASCLPGGDLGVVPAGARDPWPARRSGRACSLPCRRELEPMLQRAADMFSQLGIESSPAGDRRGARRTAPGRRSRWMVLLQRCVALFAGLLVHSAACASRASSGASSGS